MNLKPSFIFRTNIFHKHIHAYRIEMFDYKCGLLKKILFQLGKHKYFKTIRIFPSLMNTILFHGCLKHMEVCCEIEPGK